MFFEIIVGVLAYKLSTNLSKSRISILRKTYWKNVKYYSEVDPNWRKNSKKDTIVVTYIEKKSKYIKEGYYEIGNRDISRDTMVDIEAWVNKVVEKFSNKLGGPPNVYYDPELIKQKNDSHEII